MHGLDTAPGSSSTAIEPASAGHLARLFAMSPDLLAAAGFDGLLKQFNDAWCQQLGYSREELTAKPYLDLVHLDDQAETQAQIARLAQGETIAEYVCRLVCKDGTLRWMAWSGGPGDEAFYIVGRDVSERLVMEHELAVRADRLQTTNAELQEFAYTASHDLSEPLRMVASYLGLIERRCSETLDDKARGYLTQAVGGAQRMRDLIDDLLLYSRVANEEPRREQVDLQELLAEVLENLGPAITAAGASVEAGRMPTLEAERVQIARLLQNLIGNAVKFGIPGRPPCVRVDARRTVGGCVLTVADDGIGIPHAEQERVFAMFTRLHGRDDYDGTGIGLAICRRIAERHGGRIYVESEPGRGAAFHTLLPDAPSAPGTPRGGAQTS
jgi:PAS domain S-box-containing protein